MSIIRNHSRVTHPHGAIPGEILLVEDQRSVAQMAAQMLHERWGCHVLIATSLQQVRAIIAQNPQRFFLAISDLNLPDAHHGEVIDVLLAAQIRVVAITGMLDEAMRDAILHKGVIDYVIKDSINAYEYIVELVGRLQRNLRTKVLVVDDAKSCRDLFAEMLRVQGLQVLIADDGVAALKTIQQNPDIKLVLVDLEMPNMDGYHFLSHLRRNLAKDSLAVIGMSASNGGRLAAQFLKLGANDYIAKPCTYEELVCRVNQNLDMQESIAAMRFLASHDYLTGLLNRRAFFEQGLKRYQQASSSQKPLAVAVLDIDFFKKINDSHGHDGGDAVLKHFANLLRAHFKNDLVARVGGEEFFLLFADAEQAAAACEAFRLSVQSAHIPFGDVSISVTVSIGITSRTADDLDEMLSIADQNLFVAKTSGRNRCVMT